MREAYTITIAVTVALLLVGCNGETVSRGSTGFQDHLRSAVASGAETVDFASYPNIEWDAVFIFSPYRTRKDVEEAIGFGWHDFDKTSIEVMDNVCLVLFVKDHRVVYWYEQSRVIDLAQIADMHGYSRSEAVFEIVRNDRMELRRRE